MVGWGVNTSPPPAPDLLYDWNLLGNLAHLSSETVKDQMTQNDMTKLETGLDREQKRSSS